MKKYILVLCSLALLASGCNKVATVEEPAKDSSRHLTVDINVNFASDTRSVKTGWEAGDVIYVAFDDFFTDDPSILVSNTAYYMTLTYNGSSWVSAFSDEALEQYLMERESGLLAAVYYSDTPSPFSPKYRLVNGELREITLMETGSVAPGFFMYARSNYLSDPGVAYSVSDDKLTASLNMVLEDEEVHFFIGGINPADSDRYSFQCNNVSYYQMYSFLSEENSIRGVCYGSLTPVIPVAPRADGIIACGVLSRDCIGEEKEYVVSITDNNGTPEDELDDIVYTLTKTATLQGHEAINLPSLSDSRWVVSLNDGTHGTLNGHAWVKMADGRKWATMNNMANSVEEVGSFFNYSDTRIFERAWGDGWRLPTTQEWNELLSNTSHQLSWLTDDGFWRLQVTVMDENNTPGNSLILPAGGYYPVSNGGAWDGYSCGVYWARENGGAQCLIFDMAIDEFYFGNSYLNVEDKLLARFIIDESIDATGVGVGFNGYNDTVLWW